ncbi:MAG: hypothetical protein ACM3ML_25000 [Micromonosporaceae bacterium]
MLGRTNTYEHRDRPFTGFKLAQAVLSADGRRAGFSGLSIGAHRVYGVTADAGCVWNSKHEPPKRRCGCGFYCLSTLDEARGLGCASANRVAVLLEVAASGRFIHYERGFRYSRQRVRAIRCVACRCGRSADGLVDSGSGFAGWRCLAVTCQICAAGRPSVSFGEFAECLDGPVSVEACPAAGLARSGPASRPQSAAILTAEIALMQARLDDLQARVAHLYDGPGGG